MIAFKINDKHSPVYAVAPAWRQAGIHGRLLLARRNEVEEGPGYPLIMPSEPTFAPAKPGNRPQGVHEALAE